MPVIAVDPAPGKESTVIDGTKFLKLSPRELRLGMPSGLVNETLLCWDAPLTGPGDPEPAGADPSDFTQRPVEKFFSRKETGFKAPKGISVRPYSGCPHWAISRSILGLPRTGPYDHGFDRLPFHLLPGAEEERAGRPSVVEIHPAVGAWLWCREWRTRTNGGTRMTLGRCDRCGRLSRAERASNGRTGRGHRMMTSSTRRWGFSSARSIFETGWRRWTSRRSCCSVIGAQERFFSQRRPICWIHGALGFEDNSVLANDRIRPGRGTS